MEGFQYVGAGNSTNKKDAQSNAARDFLQFLVRQGLVNPSDIPGESEKLATDTTESAIITNPAPMRPVFQPGMGPNEIGEAYRPYNEKNDGQSYTYKDRIADQKKVEEVSLLIYVASCS